jgi:hypothetical protein
MKRPKPLPSEVIAEVLYARLVADRRVWVWAACGRVGRVFAALAVDMVEMLRLKIVGFKIVIGDRPGGRDAPVVADLAEVFFAKTEEGGAVEFGIAPHIIVRVRVELFAVRVMPLLFSLIPAFEVYDARRPVLFLARDVASALDNQYAFARRGEFVSKRAAAGP